jgi:predicted RNA-binding protein YlqC (UPF0109 family)
LRAQRWREQKYFCVVRVIILSVFSVVCFDNTKITVGRDKMQELVRTLAKAIVDKPEEVIVTETEGERTSIIKLRVAREDFGLIIGKKGRNAEAIRTILRAAAAKLGKKPTLEIIEEDKISTES